MGSRLKMRLFPESKKNKIEPKLKFVMDYIFVLFESDLNGLGNPEGFDTSLDIVWSRSFEVFGNSTWWEGNSLMTYKDAKYYFDQQGVDGENCLWLQGESNQSCAILKLYTIDQMLELIKKSRD